MAHIPSGATAALELLTFADALAEGLSTLSHT